MQIIRSQQTGFASVLDGLPGVDEQPRHRADEEHSGVDVEDCIPLSSTGVASRSHTRRELSGKALRGQRPQPA